MPGMDVRPTSDRLRETLFNVLTAGNPAALEKSVWIDLYAGTGAVGIEALSRGAEKVYFVESSLKAAELIRSNLKSLGAEAGALVMTQDVARTLRTLDEQTLTAQYVFLDPPYRLEKEYEKTLTTLSQARLVTAETIVIAEHHKKFDSGDGWEGLQRYRKLEQGDAVLSFYRKT